MSSMEQIDPALEARPPEDPGEEPASRPARRRDAPLVDWPAWTAPAALAAALLGAAVAAAIVDVPAAVFGSVNLSGSKLPGWVELLDTFVQDAVFVGAAVLFASFGGRAVRAWQFGLRPARLWRSVGLILVLLVAMLIFTQLWASLVHEEAQEKLLEQLGAGESTALLVASAALTCVVAPACEEMLFRGFIFSALRKWRGAWISALLTGLMFGAVHAGSAPVADLVPLAVLGFGLCLLYRATGSLYPCIAAHSINNSIAFGVLEKWDWQIPVLIAASLAILAVVALALRRIDGATGPPSAGAPAVTAAP